jgi:hypothetical protein
LPTPDVGSLKKSISLELEDCPVILTLADNRFADAIAPLDSISLAISIQFLK